MFREPENRRAPVSGLISADSFEDPEAVVQGVGQDMDSGFIPGDEFAVEPDLLSTNLGHGVAFLRMPRGGQQSSAALGGAVWDLER